MLNLLPFAYGALSFCVPSFFSRPASPIVPFSSLQQQRVFFCFFSAAAALLFFSHLKPQQAKNTTRFLLLLKKKYAKDQSAPSALKGSLMASPE